MEGDGIREANKRAPIPLGPSPVGAFQMSSTIRRVKSCPKQSWLTRSSTLRGTLKT